MAKTKSNKSEALSNDVKTGVGIPLGETPEESLDASPFGDPEHVKDLRDSIKTWNPGATVVHAGGALPPLFPEKPREGACRIVNYLGYDRVPAERSGTGNDFVVLTFDVLHPMNGKVVGRAQMPLSATMERYFGLEETETGDGEKTKKARTVVKLTRDPLTTPPLLITFGGFLKSKNGFNPAKLWVIEEIRSAEKKGEKSHGREARA